MHYLSLVVTGEDEFIKNLKAWINPINENKKITIIDNLSKPNFSNIIESKKTPEKLRPKA